MKISWGAEKVDVTKTKESEFAQFKRNSDFGPNMPPRW